MFADRLKKLAAEPVPETQQEPAKPDAPPDLEMHDIRIYFSAPKPTNSETLNREKSVEFEANFQWVSFTALVQDLRDEGYYIFRVNLQPWGDSKGDATVIGSDSAMKPDSMSEVKISAEDVEKAFRNVVKPDLFPFRRNPSLKVVYVNTHRTDLKTPKEGTEYSSKEFEKNFGNDFYVVLRKDRKFQNPMGGPIEGSVGAPKESSDISFQTAVLPSGRKLVLQKQHGFRGEKVMRPEKGRGSYQRHQKYRKSLAGVVRNIANEISNRE